MRNSVIKRISLLLMFVVLNSCLAQAEPNYWGQLTFSKPKSLEAANIPTTQESVPVGLSPASLEASLKQKADEGLRDRLLGSIIFDGIGLLYYAQEGQSWKNTSALWFLYSIWPLIEKSNAENDYALFQKYGSDYVKVKNSEKEIKTQKGFAGTDLLPIAIGIWVGAEYIKYQSSSDRFYFIPVTTFFQQMIDFALAYGIGSSATRVVEEKVTEIVVKK
jgi:hypothetical protein